MHRPSRCPLPPSYVLVLHAPRQQVKGPSDRLSDRQTKWLGILARGRALVGVCHVVEGAEGSHHSGGAAEDATRRRKTSGKKPKR